MGVLNYIRERYREKKWRYMPLTEVTNQFGEYAKTELNSLRLQGIIKRREGGNGPLVEYLPNNDNYGIDR